MRNQNNFGIIVVHTRTFRNQKKKTYQESQSQQVQLKFMHDEQVYDNITGKSQI